MQKLKNSAVKISISYFFLIVLIVVCAYQFVELQNFKASFTKAVPATEQHIISATKKDVIEEKQASYFLSDVLPIYPVLENSIEPNSVTRAYNFSTGGDTGWFVISDKSDNTHKYYLVTKKVQVELPGVTNSEDDSCEKFDIVSQYRLVIYASGCLGYSRHSSISVYSLQTGKKISLIGQFIGDNAIEAIDNGNSNGKLLGSYGNKLVIEYNSSDNPYHQINQSINKIAIFSLDTGELLHIDKF